MTTAPFRYRFRVALHDSDAAGVLFFAHLFRHAHDAYEAWMETLGLPLHALIRDGKLALPLVHAEADYRRPLRHGDLVGVDIEPAAIGNTSFTIDYRFQTEDGRLAANARTVHACIDAAEGCPCKLPEALSQALSRASTA